MFKNIDKNTVLGGLIIVLMVMVYFNYSKRQMEERIKDQKIQEALKKQPDTNLSKTVSFDTSEKVLISNEMADTLSAMKGEDIEFSNNLISFKINTLGGKIHDVQLKKHTSYKDSPVLLLNDKKSIQNISFASPNGLIHTDKTVFQIVSKTDNKIILKSSNNLGLVYSLDSNSYEIKQDWITHTKENKAVIQFQTQMNREESNLDRERQYSAIKYLPVNESRALSLDATKKESTLEEKQSIHWISLGQQFFNISILPKSGFSDAIMSSEYKENETDYVKNYNLKATLSPQSDTVSLTYFIGPSDYKLLKSGDKDLELIVPLSQDFILFRWIKIFNIYLILPLFDFFSKFISNYGIIIILMTIFIKIITAPLSYKTYKSGVAMRVLKPELDKLKAKYGDDQQKYSQEQMKLYGEYGVSPFGGCLPMLLQMPVLFAMFFFFPASIELRHQSFLWAHDLSTYDTLVNLPFNIPLYGSHVSLFALLTSITQIGMSVYSQRLQPSSPQADQMKMVTYVMPVVFLFLFNSFPAALTFYYFLQNVLGMLQQWFFTTFIIKEDKIREEMHLAKKTPKKQGAFQKKMTEMMEQAEKQRQMQQNQKK